MAGVGLCQTFPWGSRGSRRGWFFKPGSGAWGLSTNPRPRSGSKKGPGTHKGHAGPSGSRGEQPAGCCDVSAHRCQLCWSWFAKTGCIKRLGNAWKEATTSSEKGPERDRDCRRVGRQRGAGEGATKTKSTWKSARQPNPRAQTRRKAPLTWEPLLEKSL